MSFLKVAAVSTAKTSRTGLRLSARFSRSGGRGGYRFAIEHHAVRKDGFLNCLTCKDLDRAFEVSLTSYRAARSAAFYRICTEVAAKKEVDMERARTALQEHQLVCPFAAKIGLGDSGGDIRALVESAAPKAK
jgi:hypothetical protein